MKARRDGGPAFPTLSGESTANAIGMSLRDYFAGQALVGLVQGQMGGPTKESAVDEAYRYADLMLAERAK